LRGHSINHGCIDSHCYFDLNTCSFAEKKNHILSHLKKTNDYKQLCLMCSYQFKNQDEMMIHIKDSHLEFFEIFFKMNH